MDDAPRLVDPARPVDPEPDRTREIGAARRLAVAVDLHGQHGELGRGPEQERLVVELGVGRGRAAERVTREQLRRAQVGDVEQAQLRPAQASLRARVAAHAEDEVAADRMQIGRVAQQLERAPDARACGVGQVERVQRVDLTEGDDVAHVVDEANGVDALALAEPADPAHLVEPVAVLVEDGDEALAVLRARAARPHRLLRRGDAQHAAELRQRELVEQVAGGLAAGAVVGALGVARVEAVDRRAHALGNAIGRRPGVDPALRGDVEALRRAVHRLGVGHERVGVDGGQSAVEVDRQHGEHSQAGEGHRAAHGAAGHGAADRAAAAGRDDRPREPAGDRARRRRARPARAAKTR